MSDPWFAFVHALQVLIVALAQVTGGNIGVAILTVSLSARLALLPLTLWLARRAMAQRAQFERLRPELERLRRRYARRPERLARETTRLYRRSGFRPLEARRVIGTLAQIPVFGGLYAAIARGLGSGQAFLWVADLAKPDLGLALIAALFTGLGSAFAPDLPRHARAVATALPIVLTLVFLWRLSAALALYWGTSSLIGLGQSVLLRARAPRRLT